MTVHETSPGVAKPWTPEFQIKDEIYQYKNYDPKAVRVIYSLNPFDGGGRRDLTKPMDTETSAENGGEDRG